MKKTHHSFSTQAILGVLALLLVVSFFVWRNFLLQPVTIAKLVEELDDGVTFTQTQGQAAQGGGGTLTNTNTGKSVKVDKNKDIEKGLKIITLNPKSSPQDKIAAQKACEDLGKQWKNGSCLTSAKVAVPPAAQNGGTPAIPASTITANTTLCPGGNTGVPAGSWAATGYGLPASGTGRCTTSGCPRRECIKYNDDCSLGETKPCDEVLSSDPTKVVLPPSAGCEYTAGKPNSEGCNKSPGSCYVSGGIVPSGSTNSKGETCYNGQFVKDKTQEICDFLHGSGKTTLNPINNQCETKAVAPAPAAPLTGEALCNDRIKNGAKVKWGPRGCTATQPAGAHVANPSECNSGKAVQSHSSPNAQGQTQTYYICTGATPGTLVDAAYQCDSGYATQNSSGQWVCQTCKVGLNAQDKSGHSYYTCENGKAVYHSCGTGTPQRDENTWTCPSATQPTTTVTDPSDCGPNTTPHLIQTGPRGGGAHYTCDPNPAPAQPTTDGKLKIGDPCTDTWGANGCKEACPGGSFSPGIGGTRCGTKDEVKKVIEDSKQLAVGDKCIDTLWGDSCKNLCPNGDYYNAIGGNYCGTKPTPVQPATPAQTTNIPGGQKCAGTNANSSCQSGSCQLIKKPGESKADWYCMTDTNNHPNPITHSDGTIEHENGHYCYGNDDCASGYCADYGWSLIGQIDAANRCRDNPFSDQTVTVPPVTSPTPGTECTTNLTGLWNQLWGNNDRCTQICPRDSDGQPIFFKDEQDGAHKCGVSPTTQTTDPIVEQEPDKITLQIPTPLTPNPNQANSAPMVDPVSSLPSMSLSVYNNKIGTTCSSPNSEIFNGIVNNQRCRLYCDPDNYKVRENGDCVDVVTRPDQDLYCGSNHTVVDQDGKIKSNCGSAECQNGQCVTTSIGSSCTNYGEVRPGGNNTYLTCDQATGKWQVVAGGLQFYFSDFCPNSYRSAVIKEALPIGSALAQHSNTPFYVDCGGSGEQGGFTNGGNGAVTLQCDPVAYAHDPGACPSTVIHEFMHSWAIAETGVDASVPAFNSTIGCEYIGQDANGKKLYRYSNETVVDDAQYGHIVGYQNGYPISDTNCAEAFALGNNHYVYNSCYEKAHYPAQYNYLKTHVYGGKEYCVNGVDVAAENLN